jgi:transposase
MAIVHVGIDLAKNVFAVHGINEAGRPEPLRPTVPRARLHELIAALPPCAVLEDRLAWGAWLRALIVTAPPQGRETRRTG